MNAAGRRAGWASVWIAVAVLGPCTAWWIVGSRAIAREQAGIEREAWREAQDLADASALRVGLALDALRERESARPWTHWAGGWMEHDRGCDCAVMRVSPLGGPDRERASAVLAWFEIVPPNSAHVAGPAERDARIDRALAGLATPIVASLAAPPARDELIEPETETPSALAGRPAHAGEALVVQGPFQWRSLAVDGTPRLAAVREIRTTAAVRVQGFVVDPAGVPPGNDAPGATTRRLVHGPAMAPGEAEIPIAGTSWRTVVDATPTIDAAVVETRRIRTRFHASFALGATAAVVAGLLGIAWVRQRERAASARERWAMAAAHELRGPLAGLRLHGELLAGRVDRPEEARATAEVIEREIANLERVVDNVVEYGRASRGRVARPCEVGDVGESVRAIVDALIPTLAAQDATVTLAVEPGPLPASYDDHGLRQVLANLLDNAARHGGGSIRVRVRAEATRIAIDVEDDGPGLPAETERLVLRRGRDALPAADGGLGIGLALARRLARAMGGDLLYDRNPAGARFTVALPRETDMVVDGPD